MPLRMLGMAAPIAEVDLTDIHEQLASLTQATDDAMTAAENAQSTGTNARQMVLSRDARLTSLEQVAAAFQQLQDEADTIHAQLSQRIDNVQTTPGPQGPKGDQGPQGIAGPKGDTGSVGATGSAGPKGDAGSAGAAGPTGAKGDAGAPGSVGPTGAVGPQGAKGDTGAQGATGPQGPAGVANLIVGMGSYNLTGTLLAGATQEVTVTLDKTMGSATYQVAYALTGGTGLLGKAVIDGVTGQTATTVKVLVRNTGLASLAVSGSTVSVIATRAT